MSGVTVSHEGSSVRRSASVSSSRNRYPRARKTTETKSGNTHCNEVAEVLAVTRAQAQQTAEAEAEQLEKEKESGVKPNSFGETVESTHNQPGLEEDASSVINNGDLESQELQHPTELIPSVPVGGTFAEDLFGKSNERTRLTR